MLKVSLPPTVTSQTVMKVAVLGLESTGKSVFLRQLKGNQTDLLPSLVDIQENIHPDIPEERFAVDSSAIPEWSVAEIPDHKPRFRTRPLWIQYTQGVDALIYMLDSSNERSFDRALDDLRWELLYNAEDLARDIPLLIMCNKQDVPGALSLDEIKTRLTIDRFGRYRGQRKTLVVGSSVKNGDGIAEGVQWLSKTVLSIWKTNGGTRNDKSAISSLKEKRLVPSIEPASVIGYDPMDPANPTLRHFSAIQRGTECPFAKAAKLWGGLPASQSDSNKHYGPAYAAALNEFARRVNAGEPLDGFCIELFEGHHESAEVFGHYVFRALKELSDRNPSGQRSTMNPKDMGSSYWRFRFNADFFVTTFAPCYPVTSSRYVFGTGRAFILFQPELSFLRKNIVGPVKGGCPLPAIVQKTRLAYQKAGRGYHVTPKSYAATEVVKPLIDDGTHVVQWWIPTATVPSIVINDPSASPDYCFAEPAKVPSIVEKCSRRLKALTFFKLKKLISNHPKQQQPRGKSEHPNGEHPKQVVDGGETLKSEYA